MNTEEPLVDWAEGLPYTFGATSEHVFTNLAREYITAHPDKTIQHFLNTMVMPLEQRETITGLDALRELKWAYEAGVEANFDFMPFVVSLAFWLQARNWYRRGYKEQGWSFMTEAMYWFSSALSKNDVQDLALNALLKLETDKARSGGDARNQKYYAPIKKRIEELLEEHRPPKGWQSAKSAADAVLTDEIREMAKNAGMSENRLDKTVADDWLPKMPAFTDFRRPPRGE
ncbi:hypothetical protein [Variovorax boronicumulans]|uniref:hypothetical protein n=1 Tax=Variovorax boronicumulans TaxID=436515 RepID=UPI003392246C